MNEQRDELAMELFIADNFKQSRTQSIKDWEWFKLAGNYRGRVENYEAVADGLLAAGYSKPRTIESAEELDALELGAVVHCVGDVTGEDDGEQTLIRARNPYRTSHMGWRNHWMAITSKGIIEGYEVITVLYEPTP